MSIRQMLENPVVSAMERFDADKLASDLYWPAFLLTGRVDVSIDIAADTAAGLGSSNEFFSAWMRGWSRRIVIAKALAKIGHELADSAQRVERAQIRRWEAPRGWSLPPNTTRAQLEQALLTIDVFPRAAVILLIFEGMRIADATTLLAAKETLVKKAQAIGLRNLITNLAAKHLGAHPKTGQSVEFRTTRL